MRVPLTQKSRFRALAGSLLEKDTFELAGNPPPNPKEKGLEIAPRKSPRKGSENHQKERTGTTHPSLKEPHRIIYTSHRGSYKV
jgi:hypothetical protein